MLFGCQWTGIASFTDTGRQLHHFPSPRTSKPFLFTHAEATWHTALGWEAAWCPNWISFNLMRKKLKHTASVSFRRRRRLDSIKEREEQTSQACWRTLTEPRLINLRASPPGTRPRAGGWELPPNSPGRLSSQIKAAGRDLLNLTFQKGEDKEMLKYQILPRSLSPGIGRC